MKIYTDFLRDNDISYEDKDTSAYSSDASFLTLGLPGLIIFPKNEEETTKVVEFAAKNKIPLTPRAKGSSTAGASIAPEGGVIVMTDRLGVTDKFGRRLGRPQIQMFNLKGDEIPFDKLHKGGEIYARVGAGLSTEELDRYLSRYGWQTAIVPSSGWSTIGGNFSTNAGGNGTPKYGTFQEIVNRLKVVASKKGGAEIKIVTDKEKIRSLAGGQGLYGIITELDVRIVPRLSKEEITSVVCSHTARDIGLLGQNVGEFMAAMQEVTKPIIAEFMMADKDIFGKDLSVFDNPEIKNLFQYPEGNYKFLLMYEGRKEEMIRLKEVAAKFAVEYKEISASSFKVILDLRKAATGKSPGRVAIPGFEDIYVKNPKYLGKVLKAIYSITEGSLPGRPIGHQYTGGVVIHYRPMARGSRNEYAAAWGLTQKLANEICRDEYQTIKRREHGLGLELYKLAATDERKKIAALKEEFDQAGIFQPHLLTETPTIRFVGSQLAGLGE